MRQPTHSQILEWKKRRGPNSGPAYDIRQQLDQLEQAWRTLQAPYLAEFIPMRVTTCVEVYTREMIRELVDTGGRYLQGAKKLCKNEKLDLVFAEHLTGKQLSIGDFVAHTVSINGIDAVVAVFSILIDDFPKKLQFAHPRWTEEIEEWPLEPILANYDETLRTLAQMFELRHILTHEIPNNFAIDNSNVENITKSAKEFIDACDWVIVAELQGSVPKTQATMNISAAEKLRVAQAELEDLLNLIAALPGNKKEIVAEIHSKWSEFSDLESSMIASQVEGGSMQPMIWATAKLELVENRVSQLKRLMNEWMG